ncbi:MAG: NUDIX hydrolase [Parcubacteria bacterium C7867-007]|nr:MAG: NUDIX hydrolase [Parcubacteria bacterium C7867-007]
MECRKGIDYTGISVAFSCHDGEGNYLLSKRTDQCRDEHGRWESGSGAVDLGEDVIEALIKEISEEYGTKPISYEFIGFRDLHREHNGEQTHWLAIDFKVLIDPATVINAEPHKHDEIGWFKLGAFPEPLHSQHPAYLKKYEEIL